jgi:hypothetical protein
MGGSGVNFLPSHFLCWSTAMVIAVTSSGSSSALLEERRRTSATVPHASNEAADPMPTPIIPVRNRLSINHLPFISDE